MIELLLVIGITSTIFAIGIPSYIGFRQKTIIKSDAGQMVSLLHSVINSAEDQENGSSWSFKIDFANKYYEILEGASSTHRLYLDPSVAFTATSGSQTIGLLGGPNIQIATTTIDVTLTTQDGRFTDNITMDTYGIITRIDNY